MIEVNYFCGFIPLRLGSTIVAVFRVIITFILLIASCTLFLQVPYTSVEIDGNSEIMYTSFTVDQWDVAVAGIVGFTIALVITSIMQLFGIIAKKPAYMIPTLSLNFVRLVFYPIIPFVILASMALDSSADLSIIFASIILFIIEYLFDLHLFLVVLSYYKHLVREKENEPMERQTYADSSFYNNRDFPVRSHPEGMKEKFMC